MRKGKLLIASLMYVASISIYASQADISAALDRGDVKKAEQLISQLPAKELSSDQVAILQGRILLQQDETEDAYEHFSALTEQVKNNAEIYYYLGLSSATMAQKASIFSKLGYAEDYIEAMDHALAVDANHLPTLEHLIGFHLFAPGIAGGDTDKAIKYAEQMTTFAPEQGYANLARVYWHIEDKKNAEKTFAAAIEQYPNSSKLYAMRGMNFTKAEQWQKAIDDFALASKYAKSDDELTLALYQQGKASAVSGIGLKEGQQALEKVLALESFSNKSWGHYRLAQVLMKSEKIAEAKAVIAKVDKQEDKELNKKVKQLKKQLNS